MVKIVFYILLFVHLLLNIDSYAQTNQIDSRKEELTKLKDEISVLKMNWHRKTKKRKKP